jgi:MoaA/NifB/PqqE/SkfB family radical SAM enzyme
MKGQHPLDTLIFFVTSRCNSKCRTCFYWEELNQDGDLSLEEIRTLSRTMPRFNELWLSGGEPTLRADLPEVVRLFHEDNGVRSINLPVNGLLPERLGTVVEKILESCSGIRANVNVALDGLETTHDRLRGVPGNFGRAMESLALLQELRQRAPSLRIHVNSVICTDNVEEMIPLGNLVRDRFDLDGHYFQVIRGEAMDPALLEVHHASVEKLYKDLRPLYRHYAARLKSRKKSVGALAEVITYLGVLNLYHKIQAANLSGHSRWPMACTAGQNIVVLDADGGLRSCELREHLGNLREFDCDWNWFWESLARKKETEAIARDGCWCTHVCFIHASLKASPKALYVDVPVAYLDQLFPGRRSAGSKGKELTNSQAQPGLRSD